MISANVVFAAESQKVPQKIQEIANGSDDIYGDGAPLEHVENGDERFQSGGIDHTHQYIVANMTKQVFRTGWMQWFCQHSMIQM